MTSPTPVSPLPASTSSEPPPAETQGPGVEEEHVELPSKGRRIARTLLGLLIGLGVAAGAGYAMGVQPSEVLRYLRGVPPIAVVGCVASSFVVFALQSLRWHQVMRPVLGLSYGQAFRAQVVGMMFNAFLPARGGDLLRVQYLGRRSGKSRATILATEIIDRWLDWWGWFPVLFLLALTGDVPRWLFSALGVFGALLITVGTVMLILGRRGYVPRPGSRFGQAYQAFQHGIRAFKSRRTLALALIIAPLPWLWESIAIAFAGQAFGIELSLAMAFSVLIGFNIAMVVPSPGAVGTVEAGGTAALVFFGVDQSKALAFMFVYHFTQLLPGIATGVGILVAEGERLFGKTAQLTPKAEQSPGSETG